MYHYQNKLNRNHKEVDFQKTEYQRLLEKQMDVLRYNDIFFKWYFVMRKKLFLIETNSKTWDTFFLLKIFRSYSWPTLSFEEINVGKNLFQTACYCWNDRNFSSEIEFGWLID